MATAIKSKKQYSFQEREQILREHFEQGLSISDVSRKHQINVVNLYNWKEMFMTSGKPPKDSSLSPDLPGILPEQPELSDSQMK